MPKIILFAAPLGLLAGIIWTSPSLNSPQSSEQQAYDGLDVWPIERTAYRNTPGSFDDSYQAYVGVLDDLRTYRVP